MDLPRSDDSAGEAESGDRVDIGSLKPDERNARRRGDRARQVLKHSLEEFGAGRSIVIDDDGTVIAGNGTLEAAIAAGITTVRVIDPPKGTLVAVQRTDLSGAKSQALGLADNRTGELSTWDGDTLEEVAAELSLTAIASVLADVGFDNIKRIANTGRLVTKVEQLGVLITCPDEPSQRLLIEKLLAKGHQVHALTR